VTTWTCPGCSQTIEARAIAVGHRCPNRRHRLTDWTRNTETTEQKGNTDD